MEKQSQEVTDACRAILAEAQPGDDLQSLVKYTAKHGFEVIKGFIGFNGGHWSSENFDSQYIGGFEGWCEVLLDHVLEGQLPNGIDLWEVLDGKAIEEKLTNGELDDYTYFGVATGFCQGVFFKKYNS